MLTSNRSNIRFAESQLRDTQAKVIEKVENVLLLFCYSRYLWPSFKFPLILRACILSHDQDDIRAPDSDSHSGLEIFLWFKRFTVSVRPQMTIINETNIRN